MTMNERTRARLFKRMCEGRALHENRDVDEDLARALHMSVNFTGAGQLLEGRCAARATCASIRAMA
jgi:hypothetical protein